MFLLYLISLIQVFGMNLGINMRMNMTGDTNIWIPEEPEFELIEEDSIIEDDNDIMFTHDQPGFLGWSDWNESTAAEDFNTSEMSEYPIMGMQC